jgi:phosphoenolpyruvate-protein phosphotransferase (PTS system enzyme I)
MIEAICDLIMNTRLTAYSAVETYFNDYTAKMKAKPEYFQARIDDIEDLKHRILATLSATQGAKSSETISFDRPVILIYSTLFPYELAQVAMKNVKAVISRSGSLHSHAAIILDSLNVPYRILKSIPEDLFPSDYVQFDLKTNRFTKIVLSSDEGVAETAVPESSASLIHILPLSLYPAVNLLSEIPTLLSERIEGIGLYRSEFLFMNRTFAPDEIEQYLHYLAISERFSGLRVNFRLLDVEPDKPLPMFKTSVYGIDFLLKNRTMLNTQLKALVALSQIHPVGIIIPMVASQTEIDLINAAIDRIKTDFMNQPDTATPDLKLGIMVERIVAIERIDQFSKIDFMMIGSNDLSAEYQSVSRNDDGLIASAYRSIAMIQAVSRVHSHCHKQGLPLILCGDAANQIDSILIYATLGISCFSPSISKLDLYGEINVEKLAILEKNRNKIISATSDAEIDRLIRF